MPESVSKLQREKTRFYTNPGRTYFYSVSRNQNYNPSYSRSAYLSLSSRRNLLGGLSRQSSNRSVCNNWFSEQEELEYQNLMCKRRFLKRIFRIRFNNMFNIDINNRNSCKKFGLYLLIIFLLNLAFAIFFFIPRDPLVCRKELTDYRTSTDHLVTITPQDCNVRSGGLGFRIDQEKIFVYYAILNYPFHFSSVYKLHSKLQFQGKISRVNSDLDMCGAYTKLTINGINRIMNPCGSHVINVYNDQFKFLRPKSKDKPASKPKKPGTDSEDYDGSSTDDLAEEGLEGWELMELDDSKELLIKHQEYERSRNISKEDRLTFNDYYWLDDNVEYFKDVKIGMSKDFDLLNGWNQKNKMYFQLNSDESGYAMRNGHFVQWMSSPPFPDFTKLYGVLKGPATIPLTFKFISNYDVLAFHGRKFLVLKASRYKIGKFLLLKIIFTLFTALSLSFSLFLLLYRPKNQNKLLNLL